MARRYGRQNKYDSQIRRCAISGLRFYQSDMRRVAQDTFVHPRFLDEDRVSGTGGGKKGKIKNEWYWDGFRHGLVLTTPANLAVPLGYRHSDGDGAIRTGEY